MRWAMVLRAEGPQNAVGRLANTKRVAGVPARFAKETGSHVEGIIGCLEPDMEPAVALVAHNVQYNGGADCNAWLGHKGLVATPEHIPHLAFGEYARGEVETMGSERRLAVVERLEHFARTTTLMESHLLQFSGPKHRCNVLPVSSRIVVPVQG